MLQASAERPAAAAGPASLWVPGMSPQTVDGGSSRAQEIAQRREEMLGMLHDLPESEYELSLTDLVEKAGAGGNGNGSVAPPPSLGEEASPVGTARSASGRQAEQQPAAAGRPESWGSARRWDSGSSFRSSSDGVLLNFYMPRSLTRSFTAPSPARSPSVSGGRAASVTSDCNKRESDGDTVKCWSLLWDRRRESDGDTVKCWSLLWDRRWRKSSRRDPSVPRPTSRPSARRRMQSSRRRTTLLPLPKSKLPPLFRCLL